MSIGDPTTVLSPTVRCQCLHSTSLKFKQREWSISQPILTELTLRMILHLLLIITSSPLWDSILLPRSLSAGVFPKTPSYQIWFMILLHSLLTLCPLHSLPRRIKRRRVNDVQCLDGTLENSSPHARAQILVRLRLGLWRVVKGTRATVRQLGFNWA